MQSQFFQQFFESAIDFAIQPILNLLLPKILQQPLDLKLRSPNCSSHRHAEAPTLPADSGTFQRHLKQQLQLTIESHRS